MKTTLEKQVRFLSIYAVLLTLLFAAFAAYVIVNRRDINADQLTVKRLNVVDDHGRLNLVISNSKLQHPGRMNGKDIAYRKRPAGMIFFNEEGDECGGLVYDGKSEGGKTISGMSFTMDQYHQDQALQLLNEEEINGSKYTAKRGLAINDYTPGSNLMDDYARYKAIERMPDNARKKIETAAFISKYGAKRRVFIGRNSDNASGLFLADKSGKMRLKIYIDSLNKPRFEIFDEAGNRFKSVAMHP